MPSIVLLILTCMLQGAAKSMSSRSHVRTAFTRRTLEVEAFKHLEQLYLKVTELDVAAEDAFSSVITDLVTNISVSI